MGSGDTNSGPYAYGANVSLSPQPTFSFLILLPPPSKGWDHQCVPSCLVHAELDETEVFVFATHQVHTTVSLMECRGGIQGFVYAGKVSYHLSSIPSLWLHLL